MPTFSEDRARETFYCLWSVVENLIAKQGFRAFLNDLLYVGMVGMNQYYWRLKTDYCRCQKRCCFPTIQNMVATTRAMLGVITAFPRCDGGRRSEGILEGAVTIPVVFLGLYSSRARVSVYGIDEA